MEEKDISCMKDVKDVTYYGTNSGCIQIKVHSGKVLSINPASDQRIITTSSDGSIKILDNSLKVMNTLEGHQKDVWKAIEIGEKIYSDGADNTLKIWKKSDGNYKVEETIEIQ
jgi:WD40 repeat protein